MKKMFIAMSLLFSLMVTSVNAAEVTVTVEAKITGLYVAFFNRAADQKGLDYWIAKTDEVAQQGGDVSSVFRTIAGGFATHPTFTSTYDHLNNKEFVEAIYRNALGRDGDAKGIAYWTDLVERVMSRPDMVATFVELAMVTDLNAEKYKDLSAEDRAAGQLRQDLITNKATVAVAFTKQLEELSNVENSDYPEQDPAYMASIKIVSWVTEDMDIVSMMLAFLNRTIKGSSDPIGMIESYKGEAEDACILDWVYTSGTTSNSTVCYIGIPGGICRAYQGSDDEKEWHSFTVEGKCVALGYPPESKSKTTSGYTYYHTSGLYENLLNSSNIIIFSLTTDMGDTILNSILSPSKESTLILSELENSSVKVEVTTSSGTVELSPKSVSLDEKSIVFTAPANIVDGTLTVKSNGVTLSSVTYKIVTAQTPYLKEISPYIAQAGESVEIKGSNLPSTAVEVVFEGQDSALTQTVTPSNNNVYFTVPQGAGSGYVYLKIGDIETNRLHLSIKRSIDVKVVLGDGVDINASKISFILGLEEYPLDENYNVSLNVENKDMQYLHAIVELPDEEVALLYSVVVLPDMTGIVTIDADSTAVAWIFMGMGASVATDKDDLRALYDTVKANTKVQEFADYINTLQKNDFDAWATLSDEELKVKFQDALKDVIETPMARSARSMMARDVDPGAVIVKQVPTNNRIHVNMDKLDKGSVTIINDTKLYLSVEVKSNEEERKGQIVEGYHHVTDAIYTGEGTLIGPHGWGMAGVSSETTLEVEGEDSNIEIITAGILGQTDKTGLSNSLRTRTILEGMAIPAVNIALNMILDARFKGNTSYFVEGMRHIYINGDFLKQLTTEVSKGSSNFRKAVDHLVVKPLVNGLKGCLQPAITDICKDTIKGLAMIIGIKGTAQTIGKKILFKITLNAGKSAMKKSLVAIPVAGWIGAGVIAVLDNLGNIADSTSMLKSVWDMDFNPQEINIDVEFPFEVSEVTPTCIAISSSEAVPTFYIKGGGFTEVDNLKPLVYIGAGDHKSEPYELLLKGDATQMYAKFYTDELMDDGSWESHMFVKHMGISIMYDKAIRMVSTEDEKAYFDSIVPNRAMLGQTVVLNGCGWVPLESVKVYFPSVDNEEIEAEILSKTIDKIEVKVPQSAKNGLVRIQTGQKEETRWFDVIAFGIFKTTADSLSDGTEFSLEGKGLLTSAHIYFVDHEGNKLEGSIENIDSDVGMWIKAPDGLKVGLVRFYVVLSDGTKSNELTLPKLPKSPTASPSSGVIADGLTVSLSQEEDVDIYYMLNDNIAGTEQKYSTPLNLSLDDLKNTDLTLYAFARETVNGVNYDSDKAEFYYYPCAEGYELKNGECVEEEIANEECPLINPRTDEDEFLINTIDKNNDGYFDDYTRCYYSGNGKLYEQTPYINNLVDGVHKRYFETGKISLIVPYTEDKKHGTFLEYQETEEGEYYLSEKTSYINGMIHGTSITYYSNGRIAVTAQYANDKQDGIQISYYENGSKSYEAGYSNDIIQWNKHYYESGQIKSESLFSEGLYHGISIDYYESGQIKSKVSYANDYRDGESKIYDEEGVLLTCKIYDEGIYIGFCE